MVQDDCFYLGRIIKVHGFKGDVSIKLDTDLPETYSQMESVFVEIDRKLVPFFIRSIQHVKDTLFRVRFEGVDSEEEALRIVNHSLYLPLSVLPKLSGNQFYYHEVIGFRVEDDEHGTLGTIHAVLEGSGQDVFQIRSGETEILIPIVDTFLLKVDRAEQVIHVTTPEGLVTFYRGLT